MSGLWAALLAVACACVPMLAHAQNLPHGPSSRAFVSELTGTAEINDGERIVPLAKDSVFGPQGQIITTAANSLLALVFSNSTGVCLDAETRLEVQKFQQEPFNPEHAGLDTEPSVSQTAANLSRGRVGISTPELVAGSSMVYSTPHAWISIRGRRVVISCDDAGTTVYVVEGDATVRAGSLDPGGRSVTTGQVIELRVGTPGDPPVVSVRELTQQDMAVIGDLVTRATLIRRTVFFRTVDRVTPEGTTTEIEVLPVVPQEPPANFTTSPATLPTP